MQDTINQVKLDVPYHSQLLSFDNSIPAFQGCAITCVKMLMDFYQTKSNALSVADLDKNGRNENGFTSSGWQRDYIEKLLREEGFSVDRQDKMEWASGLYKIVDSLKQGNPVLVSIKRLFCDLQLSHMIVVTGFKQDEQGELEGFFYHEPLATSIESGKDKYFDIVSKKNSIGDFENYWRKMAIFVNL